MFDEDTLYRPNDPAMRVLAAPGVLAQWRHYGRGPRYLKIGGRVRYRGSDLNAWIEAQTVDPTASPPPEAA